MKKIYILCVLTAILLFSCDKNKKLNQENAEKVIKEFVSKNGFGGNGSWGQQGSFDVNSITSIEPITQFSETEASTVVHFNYHDAFAGKNLTLKFNFMKNVDKQWVMTKIDAVEGVGSQGLSNKIQSDWQNLNLLAQ
jgi:hypothetical protein